MRQKKIRSRTSGSGVLALCYGCIGRGDGAILIENKPWDIVPGMVFAKELGYEVQQFNGEEVDISLLKQSIVVVSKQVFESLVKVVRVK